MADIDSLKFSIVLDDAQFKKQMEKTEGLAKSFEKSVRDALAITNLLDAAQGKGAKATKEKAAAQKEVVLLTRQELEAKRAAGTLTEKEAKQLKTLVALDKQLLDEENKKLTAQKKQLDIENKALNAAKKKEDAERRHAAAVNATNKHVGTQSELMRQISSYLGTYVSVFGGIQLVRNLIRITGEFEAQRVALRAILQDAAGADRIFYQLQELAVKSPYTFRDLTSYAKQLSAFSVPMDEIYETTKKLADVSAGLGVDMSRIILAYGQVRSAAFLRGQEVRQFTEAGIPILAELAKQFEEIEGHAVSTGEVFDRISKRQVPFEMVEEAFRRMTSEGGKFYNMQEVLAETVKGKVSNLQDAWEIMLSRIGDANSGLIKGSLNLVTELIKNYEKLGKVILEVAVAYGTYKGALAAANAWQMATAVSARFLAATGKQLSVVQVLLHGIFRTTGNGLSKILGVVAKHPIALGIGLAMAAVTAFIMRQREMNAHLRETDKITSKAIAQAEASKSSIHYYVEEMKRAKEGTEEYNRARQAVIDNAGNFISATDAERLSLQNVDDVWVNICQHIEEAARAQTMQSAVATAAADRQEAQLKVADELATYQVNNRLSNEARKNIAAYYRGEISQDELRSRLIANGVPHAQTYSYRGQSYYLSAIPGTLEDIMSRALVWKQDFDRAEGKYKESVNRAYQNLDDLYSFIGPTTTTTDGLSGWRKRVQDYIAEFGGGDRGMKVDSATGLAAYIKKGAEALNAARETLSHVPKNDPDYNRIKDEIKFYEGLSESIYGKGFTEFDNTTTKYKQGVKTAEDIRRERVAGVQQEIQNLKEVKRWYDAFKSAGLDDATISNILGAYGYAIPEGGFKTAFEGYANQLRSLKEGNSAQDVENFANGKDIAEDAKRYEEAAKYLRMYHDENEKLVESLNNLKEWVEKSSQFTDEQKTTILGNIANEIERLTEKDKELTKLNLTDFWSQLEELSSTDNLKRIWDFYDAASNLYGLVVGGQIGTLVKTKDGRPKGYNITKSEARNAGVSESVIEQMFGDKDEIYATAEEIENLRKKANALMTLGSKGDKLKTIGNFFKSLSEYTSAKNNGDKGLDEMLKNVKSNAVDAAEALSSMGTELDKITGVPLGEWAGEAAMAVANIAAGNYVQGAFQILDLIKGIVDYFKELREEYLQLQATIAAAMRQYRYALEDNEMEGFSSIFGDNSYDSFRRAAKFIDEYEKRIDEWQKTARGASKSYNTNGWWSTLFGIPGMAYALDFEKVRGISADTRNGWQKFWGTNKNGIVSLNDYMGGEWTREKLKAYYDSYGEYLSTEHKTIVEGMMEDWDRYEEYLEQETEYYKSIVGDVASEMADAWIAAFEEAGDAATGFEKVMSNVADSVAKDLLTSLALSGLEDFLGEDYKKFTQLMHEGKTEEAMELLNQALEYVSKALPPAANEILEWRDKYHVYDDEDSSSKSLGSSIKSITEDTANLLASYLNAIRADVSYGKTQWERIAVAVEGQNGRYITLNDYMQQVAANTFDTAQNTQRMVERMDAFIRDFSLPSGYGESIKVQVVN